MKKIVLIVGFAANLVLPGYCQTFADSITKKAMTDFMASPAAVGGSIGIIVNGQEYTFAMGEKHKGGHDLPDKNTIYFIGSVTKTFTGTLLAKAVLEHKLNLNDDVRNYLDGDYPNLEYQGHYITVAQLLNHRSGLPFMMPDDPVYTTGTNEKLVYFLDSLYKHYTKANFFADLRRVRLDTIPGTKFRYSNTAAQLCGYILEKIYGKIYDQLLKEQFTDRLGMHSTAAVLPRNLTKLLPAGYDEKGVRMPEEPDEIEGAGAIKSSLADMLKYARWHLDESDSVIKISHAPTWQRGNYWAALNWQVIETAKNRRVIWQSGDVSGFASYCVLYPESKMAIVVLTNEEDHTAPGRIEKMINEIAGSLDTNAPALP